MLPWLITTEQSCPHRYNQQKPSASPRRPSRFTSAAARIPTRRLTGSAFSFLIARSRSARLRTRRRAFDVLFHINATEAQQPAAAEGRQPAGSGEIADMPLGTGKVVRRLFGGPHVPTRVIRAHHCLPPSPKRNARRNTIHRPQSGWIKKPRLVSQARPKVGGDQFSG